MFSQISGACFSSPSYSCPSCAESLEPTYQQLQKMKLDKSPFVVVSVIGQELLTASHHTASVVVLEAALKIGTCSLKLRGSVFSALSSAHWSLGNTEKSTGYMQQDLEVAKTLGKRHELENKDYKCKLVLQMMILFFLKVQNTHSQSQNDPLKVT